VENGRVAPDLQVIMRILDLFKVEEQKWRQIEAIARDAQARGWWTRHADQMGVRQALYADLEAGAATIRVRLR
jgi:predicted transcriptional regulator